MSNRSVGTAVEWIRSETDEWETRTGKRATAIAVGVGVMARLYFQGVQIPFVVDGRPVRLDPMLNDEVIQPESAKPLRVEAREQVIGLLYRRTPQWFLDHPEDWRALLAAIHRLVEGE